ncbi:MAG: hypothetical protein AAFX80_03700 [Cyanobacteria bacterium J06639_18]
MDKNANASPQDINVRTDRSGDANFEFTTDDIIVKNRVITPTATN